MSFESALSALETLVEQMEDGDLSLEQAVRFYEKGVALQRRCQQTLETAEQKVRILSESTENAPLAPFEPTGESP
ncbi:MAG: exodeoxyribonuclease VII small subunit [Pseudomonadota bacterium]